MKLLHILILASAGGTASVLPMRASAQTPSPPTAVPSAHQATAKTAKAKKSRSATPTRTPAASPKPSPLAASKTGATAEAGKPHKKNGLMQFDDFLDAHPKVQADLKAKPQLANDKDYLKAHPELLDF